MKLYTEEQVKRAIVAGMHIGYSNQFNIDNISNEVDSAIKYITPIELPSDEDIEKIAQWVIDNRYAKSEFNKVSDFEMYHHIIKLIKEQILNQNK